MKRIVLTLALVVVASMLCAWPDYTEVQRPGSAMLGYDLASDTWRPFGVTGDGKLPVDAVFSAEVPDNNLTTVVSASAVAQNVASLAGRKTVSFINQSSTVTAWISMDTSVASAAAGIGIPLPPYAFFSTELDDSITVGVAAAGVASITVYQDGN